MPALADLTIKKNDGVTNIVWTGVSRSGGDLSPAQWRSLTATDFRAGQPLATLQAGWNGPRDARRSRVYVTFPYSTVDASSVTTVRSRVIFDGSLIVPQDAPGAFTDEAVAQVVNLIAAMKSGFQGGFSYT